VYFFILGALILFAYTFIRSKTPLYGIVFFGAAFIHNICDFIACEWNPFGPWRPGIEIGLFLYCLDAVSLPFLVSMILLFEVTPHVIFFIIILKVHKEIKEYQLIISKNK